MPSVIFIEPEYADGPHIAPNDDHPPTGVPMARRCHRHILRTLITNPARWARTLMLVTYDEHGGSFDHVSPLNIPGTDRRSWADPGLSQFTGVRVPGFVISPLVDPGHESIRSHWIIPRVLQLFADKYGRRVIFAGGLRAAAFSVAACPMRSPARRRALTCPSPRPCQASRGCDPEPVVQRITSANANAAAFRLAAAKMVADHPGIASGWPALMPAVRP